MLQEKIKQELKGAMLNKDAVRTMVLRGLLADFINNLIAQKKKPQVEVSDENAMSVIKKAVKQRKDSIEQFEKGGRADLVNAEKAELEILEQYLPEMMSAEEIEKIARARKATLGLADKSKMGILIGTVMKEIKASGADADGATIKQVVENLFI